MVVFGTDGAMEPETRKAEIRRHFLLEIVRAVVKKVWREGNALNAGGVDYVDFYRVVVTDSRVEELDREKQIVLSPQGTFRVKANVAPLIIGEAKQELGHLTFGLLEFLFSQLSRLLHNMLEFECRWCGPNGGPGESEDQDRANYETDSSHVRSAPVDQPSISFGETQKNHHSTVRVVSSSLDP
jgi:hypothetical protein